MTPTIERAGRALAFPIILVGAIGGALWLLPRAGLAVAVLVPEASALVAIALAERWIPYQSEWNRSHGDVRTDLLHVLVSGLTLTQLMRPLSLLGGALLAAMFLPLVDVHIWPTTWPLALQLALALVIAEFTQYWLHRWEHERDIFWRFHATHHSAPRLYWLNAARFHPVDVGVLYLVGYVPLVMLGCPLEVIILFGLFDAVLGMLQHSNIDVRLGPLNYVFSMAELHRWHHSRTLTEANTNYGSNLIVWDLVFGTFFLPDDREPPVDIGLAAMPAFPMNYAGQLASPFQWNRLKRSTEPAPESLAPSRSLS